MPDLALAGLSYTGRRERFASRTARTSMRLYRPLLLALAISLLLHLGVLLSDRLPGRAPESTPEAKLQPLSVAMQAMTLETAERPVATPGPSSGLVAVHSTPAPATGRRHRARVAPRADTASAPVTETAPAAKEMEAGAQGAPAAKDLVAAADATPAPAPQEKPSSGDNTEPSATPPEEPGDVAGLEAKAAGSSRRFPDQSRVDYQFYYGSLMAGHGEISWQRNGGSYTLEARLTPIIGPSLRYQSRGSVGKGGLTPLAYQAWRGDNERESARFDWPANTLAYGDHGDKQAELAPGTQDILSLGYQLALTGGRQLSPRQRITTGKKVYDYPLAPGGETRYPPDHGALRVVVFRAKNGDDLTEFWLAPDYANLPVRILRVDKDKTIDQRARRIDINGKTVWSLSENP
ncbi:DUF3108 domain-containing protein [Pseudogulbenkiania sp. MAI-1]|uniref:DUF3108 domain-containing protein n=1 Tax=Pseudogulbenkiania sp. MAI-1 TaxID=990370 RepID=UPI001E5C0592|nr:DUF3108 domain-containing protein [Pseudogulbenkiania sp. MAI-1]